MRKERGERLKRKKVVIGTLVSFTLRGRHQNIIKKTATLWKKKQLKLGQVEKNGVEGKRAP